MAHKHSVYDSDSHFSIDPVTRTIKNTGSKIVVTQYDHNSERFTFEIPRQVEEHDMSLCNQVEIHYININGSTREQMTGLYEVQDLQISPDSDDVVIFSWLISQNATLHVGTLSFTIRFVCLTGDTIDYLWHTTVYSGISVVGSIYNGDLMIEQYADILEQWEQKAVEVAYYHEAAAASASRAATSETNAKTSETNAAASATTAEAAAKTSTAQANVAQEASSIATSASETATSEAVLAKSWSSGETGIRAGEDKDNARYWAGLAREIAGGDFATKSEAQAYAAADIDCGTW